MPPQRHYFIATSPRTGSFLLAEALEGTGLAGRPQEFFELSYDRVWEERLGIENEGEFFDRVIEAGTTPNGVFGAKVHWHQFEFLLAKLGRVLGGGEPDLALLDRTFGDLRYVFLVRRDRLRQAISYVRATRTNRWWSIPGVTEGSDVPGTEPRFDIDEIDRRMNLLRKFEDNWREYFESRGIEPLTIVYEDLVGALDVTVREILRYLEIPIPDGPTIPAPRLSRQSDELTERWVGRYRELRG